jgi:hypothetical protein
MKEVEQGSTETLVLVPLWVGWKMLPVRGPVADESAVRRGRCSRKMGDSGIDPSDRIDGIGTICGDPVTDEKIFRNRLLHPFFEPTLFFDCPPAIPDFPDWIRGLKLLAHRERLPGHIPAIQRLAGTWIRDKKYQKESKEGHCPILKRKAEDCQHEERGNL